MTTAYCRDCLTPQPSDQRAQRKRQPTRCKACGSARLIYHPEIDTLSIAHIDCDAFFAAVEKLDNPSLADKPVIVGGGQRGVVSTCCYLARLKGVHSAMPMFAARKLCPNAVIIKPRMSRYAEVGKEIRQRMRALTPLVEPLSIDEAFLDLTGTERLHHGSPALTLLTFARSIEQEMGLTVSVGLSHNKSMAKMASDLEKPRGFAVIGKEETQAFLAPLPVRALFGVGAAMAKSLEKDGYQTLDDLQNADRDEIWKQFGDYGRHLQDLANGVDPRPVRPDRERKSVSSERTFNEDIADFEALRVILRSACERVAKQLKSKDLSGRTITMKLKTADFKTKTRSHSLSTPTQSADRIFRTSETLLKPLCDGTRFRLLGVGTSELADALEADDRDLADINAQRRTDAEKAMDRLRGRYGDDAVQVGLTFGLNERGQQHDAVNSPNRNIDQEHAAGSNGAKSASSPRKVNDP